MATSNSGISYSVVEFNLRTAPNSTTGITPPEIALFGRELKKGVLEVPQPVTEIALDERHYTENGDRPPNMA